MKAPSRVRGSRSYNKRRVNQAVGRIAKALAAGARLALAGIFWLVARAAYHVDVRGLEHDERLPHTYYALAHKRDADPIPLLPSLLGHRGWRALAGEVRFALRSDAFTHGFLARILGATLPGRALRILTLGKVLPLLGIMPIDGLRRPMEEWLRVSLQVDGDGPAGGALTSPALERFAALAGRSASDIAALPLSSLLGWRYLPELRGLRGPETLVGPRRYRAERHVLAQVRLQLANLSAWMRESGSLLGAPEGGLTPNGHVQPLAGGLHRVLRDAPADSCVVPIVIIYDFMRAGRTRVHIDVAPSLRNAPALPERRLHMELRQTWLRAMRFTCGQLASGYLVWSGETRRQEFTLAEMAAAVHWLATALAAHGRHVDPDLLDARKTRRHVARYLTYAKRHGYARRTKLGGWTPIPHDLTVHASSGEAGYLQQPLAYAWHELLDMLDGAGDATVRAVTDRSSGDLDGWLQWMYQQSASAVTTRVASR